MKPDPTYDTEALAAAAEYYGLPVGVDDDCLRRSLVYSSMLLRLHAADLTAPVRRMFARFLNGGGPMTDSDAEFYARSIAELGEHLQRVRADKEHLRYSLNEAEDLIEGLRADLTRLVPLSPEDTEGAEYA